MKICFISNLYKPFTRGGAQIVVEDLVKELSKDNEIVILTTAPLGFITKLGKQPVREGNIKIYYLFNYNLYHTLNDYKYPKIIRLLWHVIDLCGFFICQRTAKIIKEENPDLVLTHNLKGYSLGLPKILDKLKIQHAHTLHDCQLIDPSGNLYRPERGNLESLTWPLKIYCFFTRQIFKNVKYVIAPSNFVLKLHQKYGFFSKAKKLVLPNPFGFLAQDILKVKNKDINFLYLSQIEKQKGIFLLISAFKKLKNSKVKIFIAASGTEIKKMENEIKDYKQIVFLGFIKHEKINELLAKTDLTIVPSLCYENSPKVIYESYANGVPVLVSDAGGSQELVEQGITGEIFRTGVQEDLLNKMITFVEKIDTWRGQTEYLKQKSATYAADLYVKKLFEFIKFDN